MIALSHPTGNANVRAVLAGLEKADLLAEFATTMGFVKGSPMLRFLPGVLRAECERRSYDLAAGKIRTRPMREFMRLASLRAGLRGLITHETGWASTDAVYQDLDRYLASRLPQLVDSAHLQGVYCYEDGAEATFKRARDLGLATIYDLPIGFHRAAQRLFREERELMPDFAGTLIGLQNSAAKLARKDREAEMADIIVACSSFVKDTLIESGVPAGKVRVVQFGAPSGIEAKQWEPENAVRPLRLLHAGSVSQRKGIAYLLQAMQALKGAHVELSILGSLPADPTCLNPYRDLFVYEKTRSHTAVLQLMRSFDVLVLPSLFEGQALVILEAMACGLPVLITPNSGGADLVENGREGFVVPIRSVDALVEKIAWMVGNRDAVVEMGRAARERAMLHTWDRYGRQIVDIVQDALAVEPRRQTANAGKGALVR